MVVHELNLRMNEDEPENAHEYVGQCLPALAPESQEHTVLGAYSKSLLSWAA